MGEVGAPMARIQNRVEEHSSDWPLRRNHLEIHFHLLIEKRMETAEKRRANEIVTGSDARELKKEK